MSEIGCPSGVAKTIFHAGTILPEFGKGSKATFHFSAKLANSDEESAPLDDSRKVGQPMELVFGKQFKLPIWEVCLQTMRVGEVSQFTVGKSLCDGYELVSESYRKFAGLVSKIPKMENRHCCGMNALTGNFNDSLIGKQQDMQFTFELMKVESSGEYEKEAWAMEPQEKLNSIPSLKQKGNTLYAQKDYQAASNTYQEALGRLEQLLLREKPGEPEWDELEKMKIPLLLNFSQCKLLEKDYYQVIQHTTAVLDKEPGNVKALFRRAKAHVGAWNPEQANKDFEKASELDPKLRGAILKEVKILNDLQKQKDEEDASKLKGKIF